MSWDSTSPVSADPTGYINDRIINNIGIGSAPLRNWSFVENIPAGGTAEKQRLILTGWGTGDSFTITFNGHATAAINYSANISADMLAKLVALVDFNNANTVINVSQIDANTYDISNSLGSKWYLVAFSVVSAFTMTNKTGCDGSFTQQVAPVLGSGLADYAVDIFKCAGTGDDANDCGQDFYVYLARDKSVTGTKVTLSISYAYSTTYHKAQYPIPGLAGYSNSAILGCDANGWGTLASGIVPGYYYAMYFMFTGNNGGQWWSCTVNKSGFTCNIKMTKNFLVLSLRVGATDIFFYLGLFDSMVIGADDTYPMCIMSSLVGNTNSYGACLNVTTLPGVQGVATYSFGLIPYPWTFAASSQISNATNYQDRWTNGGIWVARVFLAHSVNINIAYLWGWGRGLLKSDILCFPTGGTVNIGDTMTISGVTYTVLGKVGASYYVITTAD